ncbi:hypothetical protein ACIBBB_34535 [Streptomyces sp. NPDC051217]|uniref:hypothetical protein n=1 Tax=Streptomyces sp. NPDC051217 TaxID=3365644 RepID=UPI003792C003
MATSKILRYVESRKNLTGCVFGLAGLGLTLTGLAGTYWPVVVAGLYGAGALIAPPDRPDAPDFAQPSEQLEELRRDFATLTDYLTEVSLPPPAAARLTDLNELITSLLDPGWVADALITDPEAVHSLSRAIRQDIPESVDAYVRTRWWSRLQPSAEPPEHHLERQLTVLHAEAHALAAGIHEAESRRQESHTHYLEERHQAP